MPAVPRVRSRSAARSGSTAGRTSHAPPDEAAGAGDSCLAGVSVRVVRRSGSGARRVVVCAVRDEAAGRRSATGVARGAGAASFCTAGTTAAVGAGAGAAVSGAITPSDSATALLALAGADMSVAGAAAAAAATGGGCRAARYPPPAAAPRHPSARPAKTSLLSSMVVRGRRHRTGTCRGHSVLRTCTSARPVPAAEPP